MKTRQFNNINIFEEWISKLFFKLIPIVLFAILIAAQGGWDKDYIKQLVNIKLNAIEDVES